MRRLGLAAVRYGLPAAMLIAGVVFIARGGDGAGFGVVLIGAAAMSFLFNVLFRMSLVSNKERDAEERARAYYDRHGRWPGE